MPTEHPAARYAASALMQAADDERAQAMSAYMRNRFRFYGVGRDGRRPILRALIVQFPVETPEDYRSQVEALWASDRRESRYLAIGVARRWRIGHGAAQLDLYQRMIVEGDWWDTVDDIAANLVGAAIRLDRESAWTIVDRWRNDPNLWLRRTSLICQLKSRAETDADRLFETCYQLSAETEFFIRKAIGWSLREYAKVDPDAVAEFILDHRHRLSGLSTREATKHIGAQW